MCKWQNRRLKRISCLFFLPLRQYDFITHLIKGPHDLVLSFISSLHFALLFWNHEQLFESKLGRNQQVYIFYDSWKFKMASTAVQVKFFCLIMARTCYFLMKWSLFSTENFFIASSLKQRFTARPVILFWHIILTPNQPVFVFPFSYFLSREATNTNVIVFGFIQTEIRCKIYFAQGDHANNYTTTDAVLRKMNANDFLETTKLNWSQIVHRIVIYKGIVVLYKSRIVLYKGRIEDSPLQR